MAVMREGLLLNSKHIKMGREEGGFQALLKQLPLVPQAMPNAIPQTHSAFTLTCSTDRDC